MRFFSKINSRRDKVRQSLAQERSSRIRKLADAEIVNTILLWILFVVLCVFVLSFEFDEQITLLQAGFIAAIVMLISAATALYIHNYQQRILRNRTRGF
ncbi:MAG: hypothetical protein WCZ89_03360, partial [Phycisphaerae bacterium]